MVFSSPFLFLIFFVILIINILVSSSQDELMYSTCKQRFDCGRMKNLKYPFWGGNHPHYCGRPGFELVCFDNETAEINIASHWYMVLDINQNDRTLSIARKDLWTSDCSMQYPSTSLNFSIFSYPPTDINITYFYNCPRSIPDALQCPGGPDDGGYQIALTNSRNDVATYEACDKSVVITVLQDSVNGYGIQERSNRTGEAVEVVLRSGFQVEYIADPQFCDPCERSGGRCGYSLSLLQPTCLCPGGRNQSQYREKKHIGTKIAIGVGTVAGVILMACIFYLIRRRRKLLSKSSAHIFRDITPDSSSKPDLENGSSYFQTPIFSYDELEEATNNFDSSKELGEGGFGTVYHGKLKDGRVVAVKRLYENNYKRVEQFMNEIAILSRLRHRNLVSLYGCTSRHSRELLLVYEFVPNGTVADHLHGERAKSGLLTWSIRMGIAIESADALSYLHASDTIHRDVKTNNILLDDNFHVKVADFGLSRLFPTDATHVSTAPQGTPGYVDPEYYQCYQLNDKSDVYSFGVVLIELISAKPAVDITRHRHEINLSNMAINKIHNDALHELVDPSLGFESNYNTKRMISMVAELAFRCLQQENDMRPSMNEVLEALKEIENEQYKAEKEKVEEADLPADARLLKNIQPLSPKSVTNKWVSNSTTPNTSA